MVTRGQKSTSLTGTAESSPEERKKMNTTHHQRVINEDSHLHLFQPPLLPNQREKSPPSLHTTPREAANPPYLDALTSLQNNERRNGNRVTEIIIEHQDKKGIRAHTWYGLIDGF